MSLVHLDITNLESLIVLFNSTSGVLYLEVNCILLHGEQLGTGIKIECFITGKDLLYTLVHYMEHVLSQVTEGNIDRRL